MADRSFDLDQQLQRGVVALKGESKALQRDKLQRRYSAMGAINSMQRDPGLSTTDRILGLASAGVSGYSMGQSFAGPSAKAPGGTTGSVSQYKPNVTSRGADYGRARLRRAASSGRGWRPGG